MSETNVSNLSQVLFVIRPWDHEQSISDLTDAILAITMDGLAWRAHTTENVGYGIRDLIITAIIDDSKISTDAVIEHLIDMDDLISRVDIRLMNKVE